MIAERNNGPVNQRNTHNKRGSQGKRNVNRREQANAVTKGRVEFSFNACSLGQANEGNVELNEDWTIDSGSTAHMTPHKEWMINVTPYDSEINLAEEDRSIHSKAKGDIKVKTLTKDGERHINIQNVLYVPCLRTNLLSVSQLVSSGNRVEFNTNGVKIISREGILLGEAREINDIYVLPTIGKTKCYLTKKTNSLEEEQPRDEECSHNNKECTVNEKMLWHKRLGHICEAYMDTMKRKGAVRNLTYLPGKLEDCEACTVGKLVQYPHRMLKDTTSNEALELLHMDLCGPLPVPSMGGSRYVYVIVDNYSRYTSVYFLKTKDEVFDSFVEFMNKPETELNKKIKKVRSDNGTEFVNQRFENLFKEKGIQHQRTVPYNPESNGVAERTNRTLLEKARTMLYDAKLPLKCWAEAIRTAVYLKNVTLTKGGMEW